MVDESQLLAGETALVTGASRGIGSSIAECLAHAGAKVIGTATTESGAQAVNAKLSPIGVAGSYGEILQLAEIGQIEALFKRLDERGDTPGIVVNNAGIVRDNLFVRMKQQEWDEVIGINLSSLYGMCKAAAKRMMKARRGKIVNISSVIGHIANPGQANYSAAKAGMEGLTRTLAAELGMRGINVNAVAPGFIETDLTDKISDVQKEKLLSQIPLKKLGKPEDVALAVRYLVSSHADFVTGTVLHVNGGMYMA